MYKSIMEISYCLSLNYLFILSIIISSLIIIGLRIYLRVTCGVCESQRNLTGKVVLITGANTGIGLETARDLAKRNAKVILACRTLERGKKAVMDIVSSTGNSNVIAKLCDLSCLTSVRQFASDILMTEEQLNILILNAGEGAPPGKFITKDGFELQFQTNHLGHFLLVNLLMDLLKQSTPSRIVITSSLAHYLGTIDFENITNFKKYNNHPFLQYSDTKLANVLFMKELSRVLLNTGVTVNALHPGTIYTNGIKHNQIWYIKSFLLFLCFLYNKSIKEGAQTLIYLAVDEDLNEVSGQYFVDCKKANYSPLADDQVLAKRLWDLSEELCQLNI